jgi:hypothetical protein
VSRSNKGKTYLEIYGTNNPPCGFKKGHQLKPDAVAKLSKSMKKAWADDRMKGYPKSPETRAKMAEARRLYWEKKRNANSRQVS